MKQRRSYYKSVGSRYSALPHPYREVTSGASPFEGSIPGGGVGTLSIDKDQSIWDGLEPSVETVRTRILFMGVSLCL